MPCPARIYMIFMPMPLIFQSSFTYAIIYYAPAELTRGRALCRFILCKHGRLCLRETSPHASVYRPTLKMDAHYITAMLDAPERFSRRFFMIQDDAGWADEWAIFVRPYHAPLIHDILDIAMTETDKARFMP